MRNDPLFFRVKVPAAAFVLHLLPFEMKAEEQRDTFRAMISDCLHSPVISQEGQWSPGMH